MRTTQLLACTLLIGLFTLITAPKAAAQPGPGTERLNNDSIPFAPLARPSYFWASWPEGAMYEGDLNIPVHLWSRTAAIANPTHEEPNPTDCLPRPLAEIVERIGLDAETMRDSEDPATGCTLTFIPHFVIRQLSGGSAPVRTPTFNPGIEFNWYRLVLGDTLSWWSLAGPVSRQKAILITNTTRIAHYSNGQAGCLYANQTADDVSETCEPTAGVRETLNKVDGSFSTHYFEQGLSYSLVGFDTTGRERYLSSLSGAVRWHPGFLAGIGGMNEELARTYGRWSLSAGFATKWRDPGNRTFPFRHVRGVNIDGQCAIGRPDPYDSCRGSLGAFVSFPGLYGFGFAARWVKGWDYYNVGYGDQLSNQWGWAPMVGIMIDHSIPMLRR